MNSMVKLEMDLKIMLHGEGKFYILYSDAACGWAGWALAHLEFGSSVNPIQGLLYLDGRNSQKYFHQT